MVASFLPSLLTPIVGLLFPLLSIIYFLRYVDKQIID